MSFITGDIVSRVQARIKDTAYSAAEIKSFLNDTQNDVFNEYRLPFMETTQNYTLVDGVSDITNGSNLPSNYVQATDLILTTSAREKVIPFRDIREVDALNPDADDTTTYAKGVPDYWYYYAETIRVHPVPDTGYTVTLRYYKKPTLLSADADVPDIPSEFEELLVTGAAYRVLQVKDNYDQAAVLENKYNELLAKLVAKFSQKQVGTPTRMRINRRALGKAHF